MNHESRVVNSNPVWLYVLLQKYPRVAFLIGSLLQMLKANDFDRDGCSTFIVQFPCSEMKVFLSARIILEKIASSETLRWGILHLFQAILRRSLNLCLDNLSYQLQCQRRQYFLPVSIPR